MKHSLYDPAGQLIETTDAYGTALSVTTSYLYDGFGNLYSTTIDGGADGSTTTTYEYDEAGNQKTFIGPNFGRIESRYNAFGSNTPGD